jgi:hypothetical protein
VDAYVDLLRRGAILQEVLPSIKLVKYYGWEQYFEDKITAIRKLEERLAASNGAYKTLNLCLVFTVPPACAWLLFTWCARSCPGGHVKRCALGSRSQIINNLPPLLQLLEVHRHDH